MRMKIGQGQKESENRSKYSVLKHRFLWYLLGCFFSFSFFFFLSMCIRCTFHSHGDLIYK